MDSPREAVHVLRDLVDNVHNLRRDHVRRLQAEQAGHVDVDAGLRDARPWIGDE